MSRKRFPKDVETEVLLKCKRRCALCFGLHADATVKKGQLAHIDRNPTNTDRENAAFLCRKHHDDYDSRSRQTKGLTPGELTSYQRMLYEYLASPGAWPDASRSTDHRVSQKIGKTGVSLEVYNRRILVYRAATQFVRAVLKDLKPEFQQIFQFAADTDEALFLFDGTIAEHLAQIYKRAIRLHTIEYMRNQASADETASLAKEQATLAVWFSEQFEEIRTRFAPFLHLA